MNRRELLGKALAMAGMAALAPSVATVEASEQAAEPTGIFIKAGADAQFRYGVYVDPALISDARTEGYLLGLKRAETERSEMLADLTIAAQQRYTEGYRRGLDVGRASAESRQVAPLPLFERDRATGTYMRRSSTFEAMQTDCQARGCYFAQGADGWSFHHAPTPPRIENGWTIHDVLHQVYISAASARTLTVVDDWRRSLHDLT